MKINRVAVKYYSRRMLLTADLNALLKTLFDAYGDEVTFEFVAMSEMERRASTEESAAVPVVRDRFQVFEIHEATGARRRPDVERTAVAAGAK
jgi:hypothetical protein